MRGDESTHERQKTDRREVTRAQVTRAPMRGRRQTTRERRCESTHERQTRDDESIVARERRCESIYCCLSRLYLYLASPLLSPLASLVPPLLTHTDTNMGLLYSQTFPQETPAYPPPSRSPRNPRPHPGPSDMHSTSTWRAFLARVPRQHTNTPWSQLVQPAQPESYQ